MRVKISEMSGKDMGEPQKGAVFPSPRSFAEVDESGSRLDAKGTASPLKALVSLLGIRPTAAFNLGAVRRWGGAIGTSTITASRSSVESLPAAQDSRTSIPTFSKLRRRFDHRQTVRLDASEGGDRAHGTDLRPLVVVLDMDECLLCAYDSDKRPPASDGFEVNLPAYRNAKLWITKRKSLDAFLEACCAKYETYIFTAGPEGYAAPILDKIDPKWNFAGRLYSHDCTRLGEESQSYAKDLAKIAELCGRPGDFSRIVLVDDRPRNFVFQPRNGIPVPAFEFGQEDPEKDVLMEVLELLDDLSKNHEDVRVRLGEIYGVENKLWMKQLRAQHGLMTPEELAADPSVDFFM